MLNSVPALSASIFVVFEKVGFRFVIHEEVAVELRN